MTQKIRFSRSVLYQEHLSFIENHEMGLQQLSLCISYQQDRNYTFIQVEHFLFPVFDKKALPKIMKFLVCKYTWLMIMLLSFLFYFNSC